MTALALGDIVRVQSHEPEEVKIMWANKTYTLKPDPGESFVPVEAVFCYFGDPRSTSNVKSIRGENGIIEFVSDRATEVRRLRQKWGNDFTMGTEDRVHKCPNVEVFTLDGDKVYTVCEDPTGELSDASKVTIVPAGQNYEEVIKQQQTIIQQQSDQIQRLISLAEGTATEEDVDTEDMMEPEIATVDGMPLVPVDQPFDAPAPKPRSRK